MSRLLPFLILAVLTGPAFAACPDVGAYNPAYAAVPPDKVRWFKVNLPSQGDRDATKSASPNGACGLADGRLSANPLAEGGFSVSYLSSGAPDQCRLWDKVGTNTCTGGLSYSFIVGYDDLEENLCEAKAGQTDTFRYVGTGPNDFPSPLCKSSCQLTSPSPFLTLPGDGTFFSGHATYTGAACASGDKPAPVDALIEPLPDAAEGVCSDGDMKVCVSKQKQNCGYVNGEYRCITSSQLTEENPCVQTTSGAAFCLDSAPTEAKPDNGTPGQAATPDAQFNLVKPGGGMTVVNYYSSSTVNNGSDNPGSDTGSDQDGDGRPDGDCKGTAADPCHVLVDEGGSADLGGGGGGGSGDGDGEFGSPGEGEGFGDLDDEIAAARQDLRDAFGDARDEISDLWGGLGEAEGALPCKTIQTHFGSVDYCLSDYEDQLAIIGMIVLLIATFGAAAIIMGE